jgi:hypothetical protein
LSKQGNNPVLQAPSSTVARIEIATIMAKRMIITDVPHLTHVINNMK